MALPVKSSSMMLCLQENADVVSAIEILEKDPIFLALDSTILLEAFPKIVETEAKAN